MLTTTLAEIKACSPCKDRWKHLLKGLGITSANKRVMGDPRSAARCALGYGCLHRNRGPYGGHAG